MVKSARPCVRLECGWFVDRFAMSCAADAREPLVKGIHANEDTWDLRDHGE